MCYIYIYILFVDALFFFQRIAPLHYHYTLDRSKATTHSKMLLKHKINVKNYWYYLNFWTFGLGLYYANMPMPLSWDWNIKGIAQWLIIY